MTDTASDVLAYRPSDALKVFPIGETKLYELLGSGEIASFRVGTARLIPRKALVAYMDRQLEQQATSPDASTGGSERPGTSA